MKKHGLFKFVAILLFLLIITTYIIPGREGITNLGILDVVLNFLQSFYYFFDTALFLLVVGGLYGVLNQTGAYKKLLDSIVAKLKPNGKSFIIVCIIIFALLVSLTGLTIPLFIFIPFVISIILLLGYDKLVAFASTFGAMIIGFIGGIFINFKDPSEYYSVSFTTFEKYMELDGKFVNIFPKILLLIVGVLLLVLYVLKHVKNVEEKKVKYELNDNEKVQVTEVKPDYKTIKTWPLIVILILMFVTLILGLVPWKDLFGIKVFETFNNFIIELSTIKTVDVVTSLLFLLAVTIIFGVLKLTGVIEKIKTLITNKVSSIGKSFVIISIILLGIVTLILGFKTSLFVIIPLLSAIILLLTYDEITVLIATIFPTLIGTIANVIITEFSSTLVIVITSLIMLIFVILLSIFAVKHINILNKEIQKEELNANKKTKTKKIKEKSNKNIKSIIILLVIMILSTAIILFAWEGFYLLNKYIAKVISSEDINAISLIISSPVELGKWATMGSYLMPSVMILIFILIIKLIYKIKLNDVITDFAEGTKKMLPTAFMLMFAFTVLVCSYNNGFIETIIGYTSKFNVAITSLITILGSLLHMDLFYTISAVLEHLKTTYTDTSIYPVLAILFQTIYGLVSLVAPTSILLIIGLTYYDIPYTTWLKFIWRLLLKLILLTVVTILLVTLII